MPSRRVPSKPLLSLILAAVLLMIMPAGAGGKAASEPNVPDGAAMIAMLGKAHPRLLAGPDTFEMIGQRARGDARLQAWLERLKRDAEGVLGQEPSKYEIPDGLRLLRTSRRVLGRVSTLAMAYHLFDHDRRYVDRAWAELRAAAAFPDWNPRHFLDTAEMTCAFAIGYDWLHEAWSEEQRAALREAIITHGLTPAAECYRGTRGHNWWVRGHNNWNQVCNGGIAMGALAIGDEEPELCGEVLKNGLESLKIAMRGFAPDGAWPEGPGYWQYATIYNAMYLAALESALGTDFGFAEFEGFDQTGDFPIFITGPTQRTFNFADGGDHLIRAPQLLWLAKRFDRPLWSWYEQRAARPEPLDILWYGGPTAKEDLTGLPLARHFRGIEVATMRSAWEGREALFVGVKAGDNKASHSHLDLGGFVFDALGHRWAVDLGSDNYNLPGYFGGKRWTYYRLRAEGHNALVLNPGQGPEQNPRAAVKIVRFESGEAGAMAVVDLTPAYAEHAHRVQRGISLIHDRAQVLVQDEIAAEQPADAWWFMHTKAAVTLAEDGRTATLRIGKDRLRARIMSPGEARFEVMEAKPLPSSPQPEGQHANKGVRKLAIHLEDVREARIAVLLTPLADGETGRERAPELRALGEW